MEQGAQPLSLVGIEGNPDGVGPPRAGPQRRQPGGVESVDRLAHGLVVAAQLAGDGGGPLAARAGQQDLAPAQDKGFG